MAAHATLRIQGHKARLAARRQRPGGAHFRTRRLGAVHAASAGRFPNHASIGQRALEARHGKRRLLVQHGRPPERAHRHILRRRRRPEAEAAFAGSDARLAGRAPTAIEKNCLVSHDAPYAFSISTRKPLTSRAAPTGLSAAGAKTPHTAAAAPSSPRVMPFKHT